MSEREVEMASIGRFSGTSAKMRSMPEWDLGFLVLERERPPPTYRAKNNCQARKKNDRM